MFKLGFRSIVLVVKWALCLWATYTVSDIASNTYKYLRGLSAEYYERREKLHEALALVLDALDRDDFDDSVRPALERQRDVILAMLSVPEDEYISQRQAAINEQLRRGDRADFDHVLAIAPRTPHDYFLRAVSACTNGVIYVFSAGSKPVVNGYHKAARAPQAARFYARRAWVRFTSLFVISLCLLSCVSATAALDEGFMIVDRGFSPVWAMIYTTIVGLLVFGGCMVVLCAQRASVEWRETTASVRKLAASADRALVASAASTVAAANSIRKCANRADGAISTASTAATIYSVAALVGACLIAARKVFDHMRAKKQVQLQGLSSKAVFRVFDGMIALIFVPLVLVGGTKVAFPTFAMLRTIGTLARSVCGLLGFTQLFTSADSPFTGEKAANEVASAITDLTDHVEKQVQAMKEQDASSSPPSSSSPSEAKHDLLGDSHVDDPSIPSFADLEVEHQRAAYAARGVPSGSPSTSADSSVLGLPAKPCPKGPHVHKVGDAEIPCNGDSAVKGAVSEKLEKMEKDLIGSNQGLMLSVRLALADRPWLMPLACLVFFGTLICLVKWYESKRNKLPSWRSSAVVLEAGDWGGASNRVKRRREHVNKSDWNGKSRKPWVDYDSVGNQIFTDDLGDAYVAPGRRALRHASERLMARLNIPASGQDEVENILRKHLGKANPGGGPTRAIDFIKDSDALRALQAEGHFVDLESAKSAKNDARTAFENLRESIRLLYEGVVFVPATREEIDAADSITTLPPFIALTPIPDDFYIDAIPFVPETTVTVESSEVKLSKNQRKKANKKASVAATETAAASTPAVTVTTESNGPLCTNPMCSRTECLLRHSAPKASKAAVKAAKKAIDQSLSKCFFCHNDDHVVAECPTLKKHKCKTCGELGHSAASKRCKPSAAAASSSSSSPASVVVTTEALVNGPLFDTSAVSKSIGWCSTPHGACNFVAAMNGFVTMSHVFDTAGTSGEVQHAMQIAPETPITFVYTYDGATTTWTEKFSAGKLIGNDLLYFKRGPSMQVSNSNIPNLKISSKPVQTSDHVQLFARAGPNHTVSTSAGGVASVDVTPGAEHGTYNVSAVHGMCGGAVVNSHGQLVGFHRGTVQAIRNVFVPMTVDIAKKANGLSF